MKAASFAATTRFSSAGTPGQRFELAGAYWISLSNADRFPMPVDLVRLAVSSCDRGVGPDGELHLRYRGNRLNLNTIAQATTLRLTGIFGAQDKIVQEGTGSDGLTLRWIFSDIRPDAFRWRAELSRDGGTRWHRALELLASRSS